MNCEGAAADVLREIADAAIKLVKLESFTGRSEPTVIT
jgi:hypothetical protein